jgi:hypothetical protein
MELADLLLAVIALDTDDFHRGNGHDLRAAEAVWRWSSFCGGSEDREEVMDRCVIAPNTLCGIRLILPRLDKELGTAKKDLKHLSVRDLLRRDWKGDM